MSWRNGATSVQITTQRSNPLQKLTSRRPTFSQTKTSSLSRRTSPFCRSVARRTQCPSAKVTLCTTPSFVWLAVILQHLIKILTERGFSCIFSAEREIARVAIEKPSCIGFDYDTELTSIAEIYKEGSHQLPDGNIIIVGAERFRFAEMLLVAHSAH